MRTELDFTGAAGALDGATTLVVVGRKARLLAADVVGQLPADVRAVWPRMVEETAPGDPGASSLTWRAGEPRKVVAAVLPEACSRHNSPARPHAVAELAGKGVGADGQTAVLLALDEAEHAFAAGCAVARVLPEFSRKTGNDAEDKVRRVRVAFLAPDGELSDARVAAAAEGIRLAARLVDMPTSELTTDAFVELARDLAARLDHVDLTVLQGEQLMQAGMGGLWGVGKAARHPPAMVVLEYTPPDKTATDAGNVVWVGKGIVYDTGGLSLKPRDSMAGMKGDMGGAAAVLGAFVAAARLGVPRRIRAILCIAENAIGPDATRPDDILTLYSGRTVEVNNTDAEGRLVLADGVAYAARHLNPAVIIDVATLTGAQLISTGKRHAAIVCNDDALEAAAVRAGQRCGELVHPLLYCPEFFRKEFNSKVADMKNSVKDRMNAQSSCAAQFIAEHLVGYTGPWLHIDIAGPSDDGERGTGFGVALLLDLLAEAKQ